MRAGAFKGPDSRYSLPVLVLATDIQVLHIMILPTTKSPPVYLHFVLIRGLICLHSLNAIQSMSLIGRIQERPSDDTVEDEWQANPERHPWSYL